MNRETNEKNCNFPLLLPCNCILNAKKFSLTKNDLSKIIPCEAVKDWKNEVKIQYNIE